VLSLVAGGTITQKSSEDTITATFLAINAGGNVALATAANSVTNLAAQVSGGTGNNFSFKSSGALNIGANIDGLSGITMSGFTSPDGVISLISGGALTQSAGAMLGGHAVYAEGASVTLTNANPTGVIAGKATGSSPGDIFSYTSSNAIQVTTVNGFAGIQTATPSDVISVVLNAGSASIGQDTNAPINAGTGTKGLSLTTTGTVSLSDSSNNVGSLTAVGVGGFTFNNSGPLTVGVSGNGITTSANQPVNITAGGLATVNAPITAGSGSLGSVTLTGVGVTNNSTITGPSGVTINAGTGLLSNATETSVISATGTIGLFADTMSLAVGNITGGAGGVILAPYSSNNLISIGGTGSGLNLSGSALATISTTGELSIGSNNNIGGITVAGPITAANLAGLAGPGYLVLDSVGIIAVNAALTSPVSVFLNTSGSVTVGAPLTSNTGSVNVIGTGVTNTSTITGPGGVIINAGTGLLNNSSGTISNGGVTSIGPINLIANTMSLGNGTNNGTITGGAGLVSLNPSTSSTNINLGTTVGGSLSLLGSDLQTITTTGNLVIGNVSNTGGIIVSSPITLATTNLTFDTSGTINQNAALNVGGGFTLGGGTWNQIASTLPTFTANSFSITGGTFIRALGGNGMAATPYQLTDIYGLQGMNSANMLGNSYVLANNIDASGTANWNAGAGFVPIGGVSTMSYPSTQFTGTFNGQGHTINNLTINLPASNYVGLFGSSNGGIQNIGLVGGSVTGNTWVGALVGIQNSGSISNAYSTANVSGVEEVGGLVGNLQSTGSITNSYASGNLSTINGTGFYDSLPPGSWFGGLVGWNNGPITNSYATGNVNGSTTGVNVGGLVGTLDNYLNTAAITNSYSTGLVTGASVVGGLVGNNSQYGSGTITGAFWNTTTSGTTTGVGSGSSTGATGLSTAQMMQLSSFTGWSIADTGGSGDVWRIYQGNTAPLLISFLKPLPLTGAPDVTVTYSGAAQSGGTTSLNVDGTLLKGAPATGTNAGFYNGYYSTQQGYDIIGGDLTINPLAVNLTTVGLTGLKVYDGTTTFATGQLAISDKVGNDIVSLSAGTANTSSKNVGTWAFTSFSNLALTGAQAGNYTLAGVSGSGTITQASLTINAVSDSKTYNGNVLSSQTPTVVGTVFSGDTLSALTQSFASPHALGTNGSILNIGSYTLTDGNGGANYNVTVNTATGTITPATLAAQIVGTPSKVYDGTPVANLSAANYGLSGFVGSEGASVNQTVGTYNTKDVLTANNVTANLLAGNFTATGTTQLTDYVLPASATGAASITPATITVTGITASNKVYDGTPAATLDASAAALTGLITGDSLNMTGTASGAFDNRNVGVGKTVSISGITLGGADVGNYILTTSPVTTKADITVRPLSTWSGKGGDNLWSNPLNWDALPDGNNVLAVVIQTGASVTYDAAVVPTVLPTFSTAGNMVLGGTNLSIGSFNQSGGSLTGSGNLNVGNSFSQTGGTITLGGSASITQASGNLNIANLGASTVSLTASAGAITQTGPIIASALNTISATGTTLTDAGNRIGSFNADNSLSGNVLLTNTSSPLTITGIDNSVGDIIVENIGGTHVTGAVTAKIGGVKLITHSPLTIDSTLTAGGNIALSAGVSSPGDVLTINGAVTSTGAGASISLTAGSNLVQNANVSSNGGSISAVATTGGISMALGTSTNTGGGALAYAAPKGDVVLAVLDAGTSGVINLSAGGNVSAVPGSTGPNLTGGVATINAGGSASFSTQVLSLDATVAGNFAIADTSGVVFSNTVLAPTVVQQLITTATAATTNSTSNSSGTGNSSSTVSGYIAPITSTGGSGDSNILGLLNSSGATIGGTIGTFGGSDISTITTITTESGQSGGNTGTGSGIFSNSTTSSSSSTGSGSGSSGGGNVDKDKDKDKDKSSTGTSSGGGGKDNNKGNPNAKPNKC
jgi:hypothetical protein